MEYLLYEEGRFYSDRFSTIFFKDLIYFNFDIYVVQEGNIKNKKIKVEYYIENGELNYLTEEEELKEYIKKLFFDKIDIKKEIEYVKKIVISNEKKEEIKINDSLYIKELNEIENVYFFYIEEEEIKYLIKRYDNLIGTYKIM